MKKIFTLAALAAIVASCSQNDDIIPKDDLKDTPITVTAGVAELTTRAGYEGTSVLPTTFYLGIDQVGEKYDYPNMLMTKATDANTYTPASPLLWAGGTDNVSVTAATFSLEGTQSLGVQVVRIMSALLQPPSPSKEHKVWGYRQTKAQPTR